MDEFFTQLGRTVLERWKRENFSLEKFPEIACAALEERQPAKHVDLSELIRDVLFNDEQPGQTDSPFGEPEIVAYKHPRFYIQLLFWMEGTTAIHQHEFSGAFHVMRGSSISAQYTFAKARPITPYMRVGQVRMEKIDILEAGRTIAIVSGQHDIHSLFHLDSPSITVVVRTQHDPGTGPQFDYLPPCIAIDPHHADLLAMRRQQLLDVLAQSDEAEYLELVFQMLGQLDFERGFYILRHCMQHLREIDAWNDAIATFRERHGRAAAGVAASLREEERRELIKDLRRSITVPEHRFFLALLMNVPTRADLLALVRQRYPKKPPLDVVTRWADELIDDSEEGLFLLDALFPATISPGYPEARPALFLAAFRHLMTGDKDLPTDLRRLSRQDIKELKASFAASVLSVLLS